MHNGRDKMPTTCKLGPGTLVWKLELPSHIEKYAGWARYEWFILIVTRKINMNNLLCQLKMCKYILNSGSEPDSVSAHLEPWQPEIKRQLQNWSTRTHIPTIFNVMLKISLSWWETRWGISLDGRQAPHAHTCISILSKHFNSYILCMFGKCFFEYLDIQAYKVSKIFFAYIQSKPWMFLITTIEASSLAQSSYNPVRMRPLHRTTYWNSRMVV
jgi:hypothetical protein